MKHNKLLGAIIAFTLLVTTAFNAWAQCPGPSQRTALINLQRANSVDGTRAYQFVMTDTCGNQRYVTLDSVLVLIADSLVLDTSRFYNIYTKSDTTTDASRVMTLNEDFTIFTDNGAGEFLVQIGDVGGGRLYTTTLQSRNYFSSVAGINEFQATAAGVVIGTSQTASRAATIRTDSINFVGSFDATTQKMFLNSSAETDVIVNSDYLLIDGSSIPLGGRIDIVSGDPGTGESKIRMEADASPNGMLLTHTSPSGEAAVLLNADVQAAQLQYSGGGIVQASPTGITFFTVAGDYTTTDGQFALAPEVSPTTLAANQDNYNPTNLTDAGVLRLAASTSVNITGLQAGFVGHFLPIENVGANPITLVNQSASSSAVNRFAFTQDYVLDTAQCAILIYDGTANRWRLAASGANADAVNIYNSDGTTTDNTRIADITETITFRSEDVTADGIVPFRFELDAGAAPNEPEIMVWKITDTNDSLLLYQSDQEIVFTSTQKFGLVSAEDVFIQGDSLQYAPGTVEDKTKIRYILGATPTLNVVKRFDGDAATAGDILISDGTDWTVGTISGNETNAPPTLRPAQLTAKQDNWNPTGFSKTKSQYIEVSGDGSFRFITGMESATRDGITKTIQNVGTNCVGIAKAHPDSDSDNRFQISKDVILYPEMAATFRYDSVGAVWKLINTTATTDVTFANTLEYNIRQNGNNGNDLFLNLSTLGGASGKTSAASTTLPLRYINLNTSTSASAYPTLASFTGEIRLLQNGSYIRQFARVRLEDLSTAAEDFDVRFAFTTATIDTNILEGAYISYQREENSGGFTLKTNDGATTTTTNCGSPIVADTWYNLEIIYYPYGEVTVFIDEVRYTSTATIPENIPVSFILQIDKDNGTTPSFLYYTALEAQYTWVSD